MVTDKNLRASRFVIVCGLIALLLLPLLLLSLSGCASQGSDFVLPNRTLPADAEKKSYSYFRYKIYDDDTIVITDYKGESESVVVPDEIEGCPVVELADAIFYQNQVIKSLKLGKNVERVGMNCFGGCSFLTDVTLNKKLWSIGAYAFSGTPWLSSLSDEFAIVGDGVLIKYNGNASGIEIPDQVRHISDAFTMKNIVSVTMGDSVKTIGEFAFAYSGRLCNVEFSKSLLMIDKFAFTGCESLPSVILPDSVERIGLNAFESCYGINTVRLGDSLTYLGEYAFFGCTQMRMLYLPDSLPELPVGAFQECSALELVLYAGDEKKFKDIVADTTNYLLLDATIVYNATSGR